MKSSSFISSTILSISLTFSLSINAQESIKTQTKTSQQVVKKYATTLKSELVKAIKEGGPANGINACSQKANMIAYDMSKQTDAKIGRTTLKVRNPINSPLQWQKNVLKQFEERKILGENPAQLEYSSIHVYGNGEKEFRYMKAIPIAQKCLICHGEKLPASVEKTLNKLYPNDEARNYKMGDIRGAFTLIKKM